ncbi:MAG: hypothetical protein RLZZ416_426 [Candidatus Parcubacteria bacterium]|jgi:predicted RNA methylase
MKNDGMLPMEDKAFSSIDFVGQCLFDPEKAEVFETAIRDVVRPEHTVLDVGTGSGILALLAARAGAKKVVALEFDPFVAGIAKENFKNNGFEDKIELLVGDARTHRFDPSMRFDIVTMEMLSSGMVDEMQVQAANNLLAQGAVRADTVFLPGSQETSISLVNADFNLFGLHMKMILHVWKIFKNIKVAELTETVSLNHIHFNKNNEELFDRAIRLKVVQGGVMNALWLSSRAAVGSERFLESTISVNAPVAIPLPERKVSKGEEIEVRVRYKFGHGYQNFQVHVK